jgi:hypothetical protein
VENLVLSLQVNFRACEESLFENPIWTIAQPVEQSHPDGVATQGGWIHFCMNRLIALKSFQIFKTETKKSKTYSG